MDVFSVENNDDNKKQSVSFALLSSFYMVKQKEM